MKQLNYNKQLIIFCVITFLVCGVALGYALLSSRLQISGTGTISTNWDILFTSIEEKGSKGVTTNNKEITDQLTATFDVNIEAPGNYIEYNVTIKNNGNMDAVIESITGIVDANSTAPTGIQFGVSGLRIGDDLLAGAEKTFVVRAEILNSETTIPSGTKVLELKVNVRQKDIDSSGLVTTFKDCFQTNETGDTITKYLCGENNIYGYSEIIDVTIPGEMNGKIITQIGSSAFSQAGLIAVTFPNTIEGIASRAFYFNRLTSVNLPSSITTIGTMAFMGNQLTQLRLPNSVKTIGSNAFASNQLSEIEIPSSVTSLGTGAFRKNAMPMEKAFIYNRNSDGTEDKSSLNSYAGVETTKIVMPINIKVIGEGSFYACKNSEIELPNQLTTIKTAAFAETAFSFVTLPATLESIEKSAFSYSALTGATFEGDVPSLDVGIFNGCKIGPNTISVPVGTLEQYKNVKTNLYSPSKLWFGSDDESLLDAFYELTGN